MKLDVTNHIEGSTVCNCWRWSNQGYRIGCIAPLVGPPVLMRTWFISHCLPIKSFHHLNAVLRPVTKNRSGVLLSCILPSHLFPLTLTWQRSPVSLGGGRCGNTDLSGGLCYRLFCHKQWAACLGAGLRNAFPSGNIPQGGGEREREVTLRHSFTGCLLLENQNQELAWLETSALGYTLNDQTRIQNGVIVLLLV